MSLICGADGCPGGWVAITHDLNSGVISWQLYRTATELFYKEPTPRIIAIDIPIGLTETGPRLCDKEARKILGPGRLGSVFTAPIRPVLAAVDYRDDCRIRLEVDGKKMSWQAYNILHKIKEVDQVLRLNPRLQSRVREVHPEVCFYHLAGGQAMQSNKKGAQGRAERIACLAPFFGETLQQALAQHRQLESGPDDVLDAFAALWTAGRIAAGHALTLPSEPPKDSCSLRMEIVV